MPIQLGSMLERAIIFTDGAVSEHGAWAVVVRFGACELELSGTERGASNQQMALRAAIAGLRALERPHRVELYSDSSDLVECFRQRWWRRWHANGWRNASGQAVADRALWEELLELTAVHDVSFFKAAGPTRELVHGS